MEDCDWNACTFAEQMQINELVSVQYLRHERVKGFLSKCEKIRIFLEIFSHLLKKCLTENVILLK